MTSTSQALVPERLRLPLSLAILLAGCALLHVESLGRGFFADDFLFLEQVRGRSLWAALASPDPLGNYLRPLGRQAYFWVFARIGNETPLLFHVANLGLFLLSVVILFRLVRRIGGDAVTAASAAAFFAFHYAADVPVHWVSGAQDLLAVLFALSAVSAHLQGRRVLSALSLAAALLSKESVGLLSMVALVASRSPGQAWSRQLWDARWMLGVTAAWGLWWVSVAARGPLQGTLQGVRVADIAPAVVHFAQTVFGLEFREGGGALGHWRLSSLWPGVLAAAAVWLAGSIPSGPDQAGASRPPSDRLLRSGMAWSVAGILPTVLVASIWSAYFYLFAIAGVAILVGHAVLGLAMIDRQREGVIEAYAFRVLAPHDPDAWRKWAAAQLAVKQYAPALRSLERYVSLAGEKGRADAEVQAVIQSLQRVVHGDIAHAALRNAGPNANSSP